MFSLNRVQLIGYVTQPVVLRQTPGGQSVADLNIATPYTFQTDSGQTLSGMGYHNVTAWAGMADTAAQYLKPGSQVYVSCRLQTDGWEDQQTGEKRSRTRFVALDLILLDPRSGQLEVDPPEAVLTQCLNRADIVGNLTRDAEMRTTTGGQKLATFGVATNERWRDKQSGELRERVEFHNVVVWGERAETCLRHLKKGRRVHISGRVQTRSWETQAGSKRTTTEIIAETVSLLGVKNTDVPYTHEPRESASERGASPSDTVESGDDSSVAVGVADVPKLTYESDVKAEDLPF